MSEVDKIKALVSDFYFTLVNNINIIDFTLPEIISIDITEDPKDTSKRVEFIKYLHNLNFENKIQLLKIILKTNHPDILRTYPNYFGELSSVKVYRNAIAHSPIHYERDSQEKHAKLVLEHIKIKDSKYLSERQMQGILKVVKRCTDDTRGILKLVGKTKGLKF